MIATPGTPSDDLSPDFSNFGTEPEDRIKICFKNMNYVYRWGLGIGN